MNELQNGYLTTYVTQCATFAKTVVLKFTEAAALINEGLVAQYGGDIVDQANPETWKYYMNLAGQYHPTDTMMTVVSIDTLETIDFTVENLLIHTATAKAHAYGSRSYNALVYRYPDQEMLINGILNPADIQTAIAAESGTILAYPPNLIEPNETTLLSELEFYIKNVFSRWYNVQFAMSDNLYCAAFFSSMSSFIQPWLMNLRTKRAKTDEAHSFHVRMYLASHGALDRYLPYMTQKQALWFYRNIRYLERNPGKTSQFLTLVNKVLTDRGIPLAEYSLRQLDLFTQYRPKVMARSKLLATDSNSTGVSMHEMQNVFDKEAVLAEGNVDYQAIHLQKDLFRMETSNSSVTQTKLLDSSMVDYSNAIPETFHDVALRQWCYMATRGLYDVMITFKDPKTSVQHSIFAKDAFVYMYYLSMNMDGLTTVSIPKFLNLRQRLQPKPTVADLLSVVPVNEHPNMAAIAQAIISRQPQITPCYSVSAFYSLVQSLTDEAYWHWFLTASMGDMYERALVENMVNRLYGNELVEFDVGTPDFGPWLHTNNLPVYDFDRTQAAQCIQNIYEAGTGLVVDNARLLKNIQKAMIDLMTELSSYSIQFSREINTDDIVPLNWPAIRLGNRRESQQDHRLIDSGLVVDGYDCALVGSTELELAKGIPQDEQNAVTQYTKEISETVGVDTLGSGYTTTMMVDPDPVMQFDFTWPGQDPVVESNTGLVGYTTFARLPESIRRKLKSLN